MSLFVKFISNEARTTLRQVAATREAVKRADATEAEREAFIDAVNASLAVRAVMEQSGYADLYQQIAAEVDAEG